MAQIKMNWNRADTPFFLKNVNNIRFIGSNDRIWASVGLMEASPRLVKALPKACEGVRAEVGSLQEVCEALHAEVEAIPAPDEGLLQETEGVLPPDEDRLKEAGALLAQFKSLNTEDTLY